MKALIRADANPAVALGHLKRCIALGQKLAERGCEVSVLAGRDPSAERLLDEAGLGRWFLDAATGSDADLGSTIERARALGADTVIVDSYAVGNGYRESLAAAGFFVASITDLPYMDVAGHVVVNGNLNAEQRAADVPRGAAALLGIRYLILGRSYWRPSGVHEGLDAVRDVLVTMGGIDHYDLTSTLIGLLDRVEGDFTVTAIIGPYYENTAEIEASARKSRRKVRLVRAPSDLQPYMRSCSVAFSAGGQALYELASLGRPMVGIALWENQAGNVRELSRLGAIRGLIREDGRPLAAALEAEARRLVADRGLRESLSRAGAALIDAQGAERVSSALIQENAKWLRTQPHPTGK